MLILNSQQVRQALPLPAAIESMKRAFLAISSGDSEMPLRAHLDAPDRNGTTLVMPAYVHTGNIDSIAVKIVSVFGDNPAKGLPRILATVLTIDPATGQTVALLEGTAITSIRTAAASAAATDVLARNDAKTLAIIGAGVQAREHIRAIKCVRDIRMTYIAARSRSECQRLVDEFSSGASDAGAFTICATADDAVTQADIVCTVTTSCAPVFDPAAVRDGTHINAVGSYQPHNAEIPATTIRAARVFVDHRDSALAEAGDLIMPLRAGLIEEGHILGEIGEVLAGDIDGRLEQSEITVFKSVGCGAEDCVAASVVLENARVLGIGSEMQLD
jgi:ornithine cyclodeaminase/alanine dehydrogenase-like protein (mu-crystallin family)